MHCFTFIRLRKMDDRPTDVFRIIQFGLQHDDEGLKRYARRLAKRYSEAGKEEISNIILQIIGDLEQHLAVMDSE